MVKNYFEELEKKQDNNQLDVLFYAIMHRKWDKVVEIVKSNGFLNWLNIKNEKFKNSNITIEKCFAINLDYLIHKKNQEYYDKLKNIWGSEFEKLNSSNILTYDDKKFDSDNKKTAFDVFWAGNQPILNLSYIDKQTIPAQQVMKNGCSIVLDEVGTGKTVAGIFTIQQVIQEYIDSCNVHKIYNENRDLQILIICPYNKRNDWYNDIMRQLGRGSILIDQSDNGENIFKVSRKTNIPQIYISGNKGGEDNKSNTQLKKSLLSHNWDLVIIDECHNCFENYKSIKSKRVLLLTATPIVVSSNGIIDFNGEKGYRNLLSTILQNGGNSNVEKDIDPIAKLDGNEVCTADDIFTCNFKEDLFDNIIIKRKIEFIECERDPRRQIWYDTLRKNADFFTAIFSDQDDNRLASKVQKYVPDSIFINTNYKLNELIDIINNKYKEDSFIIFCETVDTVDMIYETISSFASNTLLVGKLHGNVAEIKNKNISKDNILIELQNNIRMKNRSILITTGKSGGTGLNLGEFQTVIHYELPFSSNELEQRFGRIERADDLINLNKIGIGKTFVENRMIFLINKAVDGEMDFETNRMLYYAITKINLTVYYMPVRNTVLFYHEFMKRVKEQALDVWNDILLKGSNDGFWCNFNSVCDYLNRKEEIKELKCWKIYSKREENIIDFVNRMVNNTYELSNDDEKEKLIDFYEKYVKDKNEELNKLDNKIKQYKVLIEYYLWLNDTLKLWGIKDDNDSSLKSSSIIEETLAENNDVASDEEDGNGSIEKKEGVESDNFEKNSDKLLKNIDNVLKSIRRETEKNKRIKNIKDNIQNLINDINKLNPDSNDYTGVFYRNKDGKMVNKKFE